MLRHLLSKKPLAAAAAATAAWSCRCALNQKNSTAAIATAGILTTQVNAQERTTPKTSAPASETPNKTAIANTKGPKAGPDAIFQPTQPEPEEPNKYNSEFGEYISPK